MIFRRLSAALFLLLSLGGAGCAFSKPVSQEEQLGTPESGAVWTIIDTFQGFQTKYDQEKLPDGANPNGQNTTPNEGDRISVRNIGYELFPTTADLSATTTGILTMHTFRKRSGENILIRAASSTLEWYSKVADHWEVLKTGYTSADFGFADNNVNTDQVSYTYFGNANEPFSRWTGNETTLTVAATSTATTVFVASTTGFPSAGTLILCGTQTAYSSKTATTFVVTSAPACPISRGVAQAVEEFPGASYPRGNIYTFADNRLFVSGETSSTQIVYFSGYGTSTQFDLTNLVSSTTLADPGLFNLAEGGGAVTAMAMDEGSIYIFKRSIIYKATLTDTVYTVVPLKAFDGKSQTTGAVNKRSTFTSQNTTFFITPDNQIMALDRVETIDYPQSTAISNIIQPTVDSLDFASSTGIVFRNKAYFAVKSTAAAAANDTVLVYNIVTKTWDSPIVGWNAGDWAIYQNAAKEELYFGDAITPNTYHVINQPTDYIYDVTASWRSKQYTLALPHGQKYMSNMYVEGYIAPNTTLTMSLLLDEDGFTQRYSTTLVGTDAPFIYNSSIYNVFGLSPFGTLRFGSNADISGKKKFRVYLGKNFRQVPFYSAQVEFASDGENQAWEVLQYAFLVAPLPNPEKRELFKAFQ